MSISITRADASTNVFTKFREETPDRYVYNGSDHSFALRSFVTAQRTLPSLGASFPTARYAVKVTKDVTMADSTVRPIVIELTLSTPAGKETDAEALIEDVALICEQLSSNIVSLSLSE